jgi:hypothetical protein
MIVRILLVIITGLLFVGELEAKSWRGIVPLKSTRAEVERLLGKEDKWGRYQFSEERGSVRYREDPCTGAYRSLAEDNCECLVSKDTVVSIFVTLEVSRTFSSLNLDKTKYQRRPFNAGPAYVDYINWDEGIIYSVDESDDQIVGIEFLPADADCKELVARSTPSYRNSWRGLIPLHSNRDDVERLLGSPSIMRNDRYTYNTDNETVTVRYSKGACKGGEDEWNVPGEIIIEFWVNPIPTFETRQLRLDERRFQRQESPPLPENIGKMLTYTDDANGVIVRASQNGAVERVSSIAYSPSKKDEKLRCAVIKSVR